MFKLLYYFLLFLICFIVNIFLSFSQVIVSTYAGNGNSGLINGPALSAEFNRPSDVCVDYAGNIIVADNLNHCIRKIDINGMVSILAGNGTAGFADGTGLAARFNRPWGVCVDSLNNIYVTDVGNERIRKVTPLGVVTTIAGTGVTGNNDGPALSATFNSPYGICTDGFGNFFIVDNQGHRVRKLSNTAMVSTIAGSTAGYADGIGSNAHFNQPQGITIDAQGFLYVADRDNHRIRKITQAGVVTTIAGNGVPGFLDADSTNAMMNGPRGIRYGCDGNLYFADAWNNRIRKIDSQLYVSTVAGSGVQGFLDGPGSTAQFNYPWNVWAANDSTLYIAGNLNHRIRKISIEPLSVIYSVFPDTQCVGQPIQFDASASHSVIFYDWTFIGGNISSSSLSSPSVIYNTQGTYVYQLTVSNYCSSMTIIDSVVIIQLDSISISNDTSVCSGETVVLTASGGTFYTWSTGSTNSIISVSPTVTTTYYITVSNGTCESFDSVTVNVISPVINITSSSPVCVGDTVFITANGGTSYLWSTGETTSSIAHQIWASTTYYVTFSDGNCQGVDSILISILQPPIPDISGDSLLCSGDNASLFASGGTSYLWSTGDTTASIFISPDSSTLYYVTVSNACGSVVDSFYLSVLPSPVAYAGQDTTIRRGESAQLAGSGGPGWHWTPSTGLSCTDCPNPVASPEETTTYYLTVDNGYCSATDSVTVYVLDMPCDENSIFIPNVFSPNGDMENDVIEALGQGFSVQRFMIYNRWGEQVYDLAKDGPFWEGTLRGKPAPAEVYVYYLEALCSFSGQTVIKKGNITLVR